MNSEAELLVVCLGLRKRWLNGWFALKERLWNHSFWHRKSNCKYYKQMYYVISVWLKIKLLWHCASFEVHFTLVNSQNNVRLPILKLCQQQDGVLFMKKVNSSYCCVFSFVWCAHSYQDFGNIWSIKVKDAVYKILWLQLCFRNWWR